MSVQLPLILASASPRRKQLLTGAGFVFDIQLPDSQAEDDRLPNELPIDYVKRLAFQKASSVAKKAEQGIVLGCDTIVLCNENILEKPMDRNDARNMLRQLSGQVHQVLSGLCLIKKEIGHDPTVSAAMETTQLLMSPIAEETLERYLDTDQWQGKAGAFGYQDGNDWITILEGSESNVVGLPLELFKKMYRELDQFLVDSKTSL